MEEQLEREINGNHIFIAQNLTAVSWDASHSMMN